MNGIVVIDKPKGKTSHAMVNFMRRLTGIKKIGHTGTLDPMATGVLPICIGNATKVCDMLTLSDKTYIASFQLGRITDTQDAEGRILHEYCKKAEEEEIIRTVRSFIGEIEQIPPMFSAIKKDGRKLYELARQGIEIEREKRTVKIYDIDILDINTARQTMRFSVSCSKGTYIRTLGEDIGKKLGTGAYMTELRRTRAGRFDITDARTQEDIEELSRVGKLDSILIKTDRMFEEYPELILNEKQTRSIINGIRMTWRNGAEGQSYRLYDNQHNFLCVSKCVDGKLTLEKSFWS